MTRPAGCTCRWRDTVRLARVPHRSPDKGGCPVHTRSEVCTSRRINLPGQSAWAFVTCNTRLNGDGTCPRTAEHDTAR